jgi:hypothetical protein
MKDFIALSLVLLYWTPPLLLSIFFYRLTKDPDARPIPRDMLVHPWFSKASKRKVDMAQWIREVWNWDVPAACDS